MEAETLDLPELARYLQRDLRDLERMAAKGQLPGRRIAGRWAVNRTEIHHWIENALSGYSDPELAVVEVVMAPNDVESLVVAPLMSPETSAVPLQARTAPGVLDSLVQIANATWQVYEPDRILSLVRDRESQMSTAVGGGVAIPHPGRRAPDSLGEPVVAFGRTFSGIPFGGPKGELTDLFFLVLCPDDATHLRVLARLSRLFLREGFLDKLREADTPTDAIACISEAEAESV